MRKRWIIVPLMAMLTGCGDPLAGIEQVTDADDPTIDVAANAVPTADEMARDEPIFARLFRRAEPDPDATPDVALDTVADPAPDLVKEEGVATEDVDVAITSAVEEPVDPAQAQAQEAAERPKGVLDWLRRAAAAQSATDVTEPVESAADAVKPLDTAAEASTLAIPPEPAPEMAAAPIEEVDPKPRGLFGRKLTPRQVTAQGPDALDVPLGTMLPFGEVARVCDARGQKLGKLVEQAARKGANYKLYDTAPDSAAPRIFYVTGFSDHCPRQFTAALALFGAPQMHEQLRYGLPAEEYPYSTTDKAYEKVKSQVCRVGRAKPCGTRISRLDQTTVFVSAYENFTENARWADILLHEGAVLAAALKTP
mmetsp:Transcript_23459/g.41228  ORF Transcript_23459/g.41228 Transcript_23459/m.41228 type:complete len:367 (-) Transcript_23459:45-1145(-)